MEDGGGSFPGGQPATASLLICALGPARSAPSGPLPPQKTCLQAFDGFLLEGGHKTGWASPACPLGGDEAQPPLGGHEVSSKGKSTARLERKQRKIRDVPGLRGLQRVLRSAAPVSVLFVSLRGRPWSSSQPMTSLRSIAFSPPLLGSFFF